MVTAGACPAGKRVPPPTWGSMRAHGSWHRAQEGLSQPCALGAGWGGHGSGRRGAAGREHPDAPGAQAAAAAAGAAMWARPLPATAGLSLIPPRREGGREGTRLPSRCLLSCTPLLAVPGGRLAGRWRPLAWRGVSPPGAGGSLTTPAPVLKVAGKGLRAPRRASRPAPYHSRLSSPSSHACRVAFPCLALDARCSDGGSVPRAHVPSLSIPTPASQTAPPAPCPHAPGTPAPAPPPARVAMPGTSSAPWVLPAQVPRGTLIFNFLSKPLAGESSAWHGGAADARCHRGAGRQVAPGHGGLGWGTQPSAASRSCAAPCPRRAGERRWQMCARLQGGRGGRQQCRPGGDGPLGLLVAWIGQGDDPGGESTPSLTLAAPVAAPARGARRDGASLRAAPRAAGPETLHPCIPLKGSQGIAVWRKLPACPGEGGSYK